MRRHTAPAEGSAEQQPTATLIFFALRSCRNCSSAGVTAETESTLLVEKRCIRCGEVVNHRPDRATAKSSTLKAFRSAAQGCPFSGYPGLMAQSRREPCKGFATSMSDLCNPYRVGEALGARSQGSPRRADNPGLRCVTPSEYFRRRARESRLNENAHAARRAKNSSAARYDSGVPMSRNSPWPRNPRSFPLCDQAGNISRSIETGRPAGICSTRIFGIR